MMHLFQDVPDGHSAMSAMIIYMAANALSLGNAVAFAYRKKERTGTSLRLQSFLESAVFGMILVAITRGQGQGCDLRGLHNQHVRVQKKPARVLRAAGKKPVAVLNHNRPAFYMITPELFEALVEELSDRDLIVLAH